MNLNDRILSRRYARALYESAVASGEQKKIGADLTNSARSLKGRIALFSHPQVSAKDKKETLGKLLDAKLQVRTKEFLHLLIDKKRFALLPMMERDFVKFCDEGAGIAHAMVRAARELSAQEREGLGKRLAARSGKKVILDVKVDSKLLGGVVVRMGDWVFDASLKGALKRMRARLAA